MASSGVLYMKGLNQIDSNEEMEEEEEDIWDDRKLNVAYDKALKMANLEVAKRVAMATNSTDSKKDKPGENSQPQSQSIPPKANKPHKKSKQNKGQKKALKQESTTHVWKEGMMCRATYSADGFDYEATVLTILDDDSCVIRYLGYNNTEILPISALQPSLGKQARRDQMMEAMAARQVEASSTHSTDMENDVSESTHVKKTLSSTKRRAAKNKRPDVNNGFTTPNMHMPEVSSILREFGQMEMPTPPPPPPVAGMADALSASDDQALSNMLVSWYMSGYYTGLYNGMKRSRQRHHDY